MNIARSGRTSSLALPASVIVPLLEDMKAGKMAPPPEMKAAQKERREAIERVATLERRSSQLYNAWKESKKETAAARKALEDAKEESEGLQQAVIKAKQAEKNALTRAEAAAKKLKDARAALEKLEEELQQ